MKFLCVPCDQPMKLATVRPPDRGSLSVLYSCPACGYEMAMLTNPHETQLVTSLGVRIGPGGEAQEMVRSGQKLGESVDQVERMETAEASRSAAERARDGGCPFADIVAEMEEAGGTASGSDLTWTEGASARLAAIPEFVRPMARSGIEKYAREHGYPEVTERVLEEARAAFGV